MNKILSTLFLAFSGFIATAQTQVLADTSMEATGWTSTSVTFGTVICDAGTCGTCGGPCNPHTGTYYAWFGGAGGSSEVGTISQTFNVSSAGTAVLNFWYFTPILPSVLGDSMSIKIDGVEVWSSTAADSNLYKTAYTNVSQSLGSMAAGSHTIFFRGTEFQSQIFNQLIDDITLVVSAASGVEQILLDENISVKQNFNYNELFVSFNLPKASNLTMTIYDAAGKNIYSQNLEDVTNQQTRISTANFTPGNYIIDFKMANANPFAKPFVVTK